jgi:MADS-box transcription factor
MQLTWWLKTCSSCGGLKTESLLQNLIIFLIMQEQELEEENKQLKTKVFFFLDLAHIYKSHEM